MAEVKLFKLSVTGQQLEEKLAKIEQNLEAINANFAADEEFKSLVAATYATKEELSKLYDNDTESIDSIVEIINLLDSKVNAGEVASLLNEKADKSELNDYQPKGNYLTEHQSLSGYATETYVDNKITALLNGVDADHDTLKEIVDLLNDKQDAVEFITALQSKADKADLENYQIAGDYVSKTDFDTELENYQPKGDYLTEHQDLSTYATKAELEDYQPKGEYLTEHQSLADYALKSELPEVPSIDGLISEEDADAKYQPKGEYLTEHQSLANYALKSELPEVPSIEGLATEDYVNNKISEVIDGAPDALNTLNEIATELAKKQGTAELIDILGTKANVSDLDNYALKSELPEVPSVEGLISEEDADAKYQPKGEYLVESDLNDYALKSELPDVSGFITEHQDLSAYALKSEVPTIPTKVSAFENDAEYLTEHQSLDDYATKEYVNEKISYLLDGVDEEYDTLKELAYAINNNEDGLNNINTILGYKANEEDVYDKVEADDKFVDKAKYDELNTKYTTLFNVVYQNATGDTATALNADYVANNLSNTNTSVEITEGELGDVIIPETTKTMTVTAPMQDNSTITLSSPKTFNLNNTSENPVAVTIDAPAGTSIPTMNVSGKFDTLEVNNGSITGKNDATVSNVIINNDIEKNASVTGVVYNDNATITTNNLPKLGLANNNNSENVVPSATINAENTTVTLNKSQWNELTSNVSDETLIVTQNAHINKLIVGKGNVVVYDNDMSNRISEVVNDTEYTVDLNRNTATTAAEVASLLTGNPGIITLGGDFTRGRIAGGILWSGNYTLDLAGHTLDLTNTNYAIMGRNTVNITIIDSVGGGKIVNNSGYGLWAGDNSVFTIDVPETTEISAVTHTLYCEGSKRPHINVKGGTYKMTVGSDDVNPYDDNGNYRYMFNHYDSTFTREGNCFTITGGIFYGFDPSRMYGDPYTDPITGEHYYSMIDTNVYKVEEIGTFVDSKENTMKIYKVVKK